MNQRLNNVPLEDLNKQALTREARSLGMANAEKLGRKKLAREIYQEWLRHGQQQVPVQQSPVVVQTPAAAHRPASLLVQQLDPALAQSPQAAALPHHPVAAQPPSPVLPQLAVTGQPSAQQAVAPAQRQGRDWWVIGTFIVTFITMIGVWLQSWAAMSASKTALDSLEKQIAKTNTDDRANKVLTWQKLKVYNIIEKSTSQDRKPLSFDEIQSKYLEVVRLAKKSDVDLSEQDIQPDTLKLILLELAAIQLVFPTYPGPRYTTQEYVFQAGIGRLIPVQAAKVDIVSMVADQPGQHTSQELAKAISPKYGLTLQEARGAVIDNIVAKAVIVGKDNKLWPADNPPPTQDK